LGGTLYYGINLSIQNRELIKKGNIRKPLWKRGISPKVGQRRKKNEISANVINKGYNRIRKIGKYY
jgi:hypothetical protein